MYISQLNNLQFKGTTKFLSCNSEGKKRCISDCPFGTASFGETRGLSDFVKKRVFPNASVEETIGKFHDNPTHKIYFADPMEAVNDLIKSNHDYIVYDCEPSFPVLKKVFFDFPELVEQSFRDVKDYFARLAHVESPTLMQKNQMPKIADICLGILDECKGLTERKSVLERRIKAKKEFIKNVEENISAYKLELEKKKVMLANHYKTLAVKKRKLDSLEKKSVNNKNSAKTAEIMAKIDACNETINKIKSKITIYTQRVEYIEQYLAGTPLKIAACKTELVALVKELSSIIRALVPSYKKLCNLYVKQGIKIIPNA